MRKVYFYTVRILNNSVIVDYVLYVSTRYDGSKLY